MSNCPNRLHYIGMSHLFHNQNFSLIHQLFNKGIIRKMQFALEVYTNGIRENLIHFGGVPSNILSYRKHKQTILVNKDQLPWEFNIHALGSGDRVMHVDRKVVFHLERSDLIVDREVYEWLREEVYIEYILDGLCKERKTVSNLGEVIAQIKCSRKEMGDDHPQLFIEHGYQRIALLHNDIDDDNFFRVNVEYSSERDGTKEIVLPCEFFANRVVLFDYDQHEITVHMSEGKNTRKDEGAYMEMRKDKEEGGRGNEVVKEMVVGLSVGLSLVVFGIVMVKDFWGGVVFGKEVSF